MGLISVFLSVSLPRAVNCHGLKRGGAAYFPGNLASVMPSENVSATHTF